MRAAREPRIFRHGKADFRAASHADDDEAVFVNGAVGDQKIHDETLATGTRTVECGDMNKATKTKKPRLHPPPPERGGGRGRGGGGKNASVKRGNCRVQDVWQGTQSPARRSSKCQPTTARNGVRALPSQPIQHVNQLPQAAVIAAVEAK